MDYVIVRVQGSYPERTPQPERRFPLSLLPWPPPPPSVESFNSVLERLAGDARVQGAVLLISSLAAGPATIASLRQTIARFRGTGKEAVAYVQDLGMWSYYLASACDQVFSPESGGLKAAGLWSEAIFLKDTLALAGIEADFEAIAEYKVSPDRFRRSKMTEPHREMLDSLLDSIYETVLGAIAEGRGLAPEKVRALLDSVPLQPEEMLEAGLLDGVCYEDELAVRLGDTALLTWKAARKRLVRPIRWHSKRAIGVISLEGLIVPGASRRPPLPIPLPLPVPEKQAGSDTLVAQLRTAARDNRLAAVILHIDSPGGSALASDLIWREVVRLRWEKPVVVYMGDIAASGGYYVSAPADAIYAQDATLTGSIGIWGGKVVTQGLYRKLKAGREVVSRGEAAGLYADDDIFSDEERRRIRANLGQSYTRFKARVAEGRGLKEEELEVVARGRVWTGEQAAGRGLVDKLGDLHAAAEKARELAGVPTQRYMPLVKVRPPKEYQSPLPTPTGAQAWLGSLGKLLREGTLALAPWAIHIRD
jgi:protease-4